MSPLFGSQLIVLFMFDVMSSIITLFQRSKWNGRKSKRDRTTVGLTKEINEIEKKNNSYNNLASILPA